MKGRGWRRIGIVLSVMWFVGFFGYWFVVDYSERQEAHVQYISYCYSKFDWNTQRAEERRAPARSYSGNSGPVVGMIVAVDLATILIGWLIAWVVIAAVRWVARGFAQNA